MLLLKFSGQILLFLNLLHLFLSKYSISSLGLEQLNHITDNQGLIHLKTFKYVDVFLIF